LPSPENSSVEYGQKSISKRLLNLYISEIIVNKSNAPADINKGIATIAMPFTVDMSEL
jgi:hypothetical protein